MNALKTANLALAFGLELCGLGALAYWGYQAGQGWMKVALAIGAPLAFGVGWGLFVAPKSVIRVRLAVKSAVSPLLLLVCAAALAASGMALLAATFAVLVLVNGGLGAVWKQRSL